MSKQNFLTTFAIALASTALGIFAYHLYATEQLKKRDELWQARIDGITANIDTLAEKAITRIAGERVQSEQAAISRAIQIERLAQGIASVAGLRTNMAVHLAEQGKLPQNLTDLHYAPDWLPYQHLAEIRLRRSGAIELQFRADSQLNGKVLLTPQVETAYGMITGWTCSSADFDFVAQAAADCQYQAKR